MKQQSADWNAFVSGHAAGHLLQTSEWGALKSRFGWWERRFQLPAGEGRSPLAGALILFRKTLGQVLAYVPRGPLVDWNDAARAEEVVAGTVALARQEGAFALKIEPGLADTAENRQRLSSAGFRPSPHTVQPRSTVVVDIRPDEQTILARMKSKWRYNIRLAQRKGVEVRALPADELPLFQDLLQETGGRDGFSVHSAEYYRAAYELLASRWGVFLLATHRGEALASVAVFAVGSTAWYLWGASSNRRRNLMPNHALQWEAIRWAKQRGCARYDLWGIPDPIGAVATALWAEGSREILAEDAPVDVNAFPTGELWGVFRFKQGFGGVLSRTVGAWDLPLSPAKYGLYRGALLAKDRVGALHKLAAGDAKCGNGERPAPSRTRLQPVELKAVRAEAEWDQLSEQFPPGSCHALQCWAWGEVKAGSGWHVERWSVERGERALGAFQFLWRQPVAGMPLRVAYVPKGPVLNWSDDEAVGTVLEQIEELCRERACVHVKIDADVAESQREGRLLRSLFAQRGWRFSPEQVQFKNTGFTDISMPEEVLLASFKSKWRYNIRLAQRRGVTVRSGQVGDLAGFYRLYEETGARDRFLIRPFAYYEALWRRFLEMQESGSRRGGGALLLAEHPEEDRPLAGLFLLRHGRQALYFNGASSGRRRRDMPNYLLQWRAMQWAKAQGCAVYDWWGAPTDPGDACDPMQGVWRFKEGFAAALAVHIGAWDWSPNPLLWHGYQRGKAGLFALLRP